LIVLISVSESKARGEVSGPPGVDVGKRGRREAE